jgi:hypothetical protein
MLPSLDAKTEISVDINLSTNPYIATRKGDLFGGEAGQDNCGTFAIQILPGADTFAAIGARRPGNECHSQESLLRRKPGQSNAWTK